jgi:tetratricopeptide (TPR) repeat protein
MMKTRTVALTLAAGLASGAASAEAPAGRRFEWTTKSAEARALLTELQGRIESFQAGPQNVELARRIVAADPAFAMGQYYLSAVTPPPEAEAHYQKARELAKAASDGERRFIEAMFHARVNGGVEFRRSIEPLEALSKDYPSERLVYMLLGQLYAGDSKADRARESFEKALQIGPRSPRAEAFLAADDLLKGQYAKARSAYEAVEKSLQKGSVPFAVRFGLTFSHLYEGQVDAALDSLRTYLAEYKAGGLDQQFPEVFIWNAMARISLENGRLDEAMKAYEKGYESVPGSSLPEDQKATWLGRLRHGKCRVLAKLGRHQEAWAEAEAVRRMIVDGGEAARQYWPAYHYLAGYTKLEAGDPQEALAHLLQADPNDPFQTLLLGRAYERVGKTDEAKKAFQKIVDSQWPGIERPLAFPEATRRLQAM